MNFWLLLEKSDETRVSKGIDGYRDSTGESYHFDNLVPNHKNIKPGDFVVLRKENEIIGIGEIGEIRGKADAKIHRRCPQCASTDIRERAKKLPKWKCGKCKEEFYVPNETIVDVSSFEATISNFTRLDAPPLVKTVKMCAASDNGESSQLSMLLLDPAKVQTLFEGITPLPSPLSHDNLTSGQGFGLSQAERKAVELRAMQVGRALYEGMGWKVIDMSTSQPFDFLATKGSHKRFIEIKGTTGEGHSVVLTHGEVKHVHLNPKDSALVIVSGITLLLKNGIWLALGGTVTKHEDPWQLNDNNLTPTQYRYEIQ